MSKRPRFTLLEIMLSVAILALVASLLALPLSDMLRTHRFKQSVKRFVIHLKEMQALALNYQGDMRVEIYREQGKLMCKAMTDETITLFKAFELKGISSLTFDKKKARIPMTWNIFASGRITPQGLLHFIGDKESVQIDLRNSPHIKIKEIKDATEEPSL